MEHRKWPLLSRVGEEEFARMPPQMKRHRVTAHSQTPSSMFWCLFLFVLFIMASSSLYLFIFLLLLHIVVVVVFVFHHKQGNRIYSSNNRTGGKLLSFFHEHGLKSYELGLEGGKSRQKGVGFFVPNPPLGPMNTLKLWM